MAGHRESYRYVAAAAAALYHIVCLYGSEKPARHSVRAEKHYGKGILDGAALFIVIRERHF